MKYSLFFLITLIAVVSCKTNDKKVNSAPLTVEQKQTAANDTANFTSIEWLDSTTKNLGKLKQDQTIEVSYRFKNSGTKNLIIENVSASCGCTIPEKPEQAFAPGEEGVIKAKFNGSGHGAISKQVSVLANTNPSKTHVLIFTGEVGE